MWLVVYYVQTGDAPPMYWRGWWDQNMDMANPYPTREDAETMAEYLEGFPDSWYEDRCVRVVQR